MNTINQLIIYLLYFTKTLYIYFNDTKQKNKILILNMLFVIIIYNYSIKIIFL